MSKKSVFSLIKGVIMADKSLDIVSKIDTQNLKNAINQSIKEINQRFDFKGSKSEIKLDGENITVISDDDFKLKRVMDVFKSKLIHSKISLKSLDIKKQEKALGGLVKHQIKLQNGISQDNAKKIVKDIKSLKTKVQAQIQGEQVRISGKKIDELRAVMTFLEEQKYDFNIEFTNFK